MAALTDSRARASPDASEPRMAEMAASCSSPYEGDDALRDHVHRFGLDTLVLADLLEDLGEPIDELGVTKVELAATREELALGLGRALGRNGRRCRSFFLDQGSLGDHVGNAPALQDIDIFLLDPDVGGHEEVLIVDKDVL